jgi:hypothetical protein
MIVCPEEDEVDSPLDGVPAGPLLTSGVLVVDSASLPTTTSEPDSPALDSDSPAGLELDKLTGSGFASPSGASPTKPPLRTPRTAGCGVAGAWGERQSGETSQAKTPR